MKEPHTGPGWLLYLWLKYQRHVENAMQPSAPNREGELEYISNRLFTKSILYGLPIAVFATIASVLLNLNTGKIFLPCFGVAMLLSVGLVCLNVRIPLNYRKIAVS